MVKQVINQTKQATVTTVEFSKQLAHFLEAVIVLIPTVTGIYVILDGRGNLSGLGLWATVFCGVVAAVGGLVGLYKVLMKK